MPTCLSNGGLGPASRGQLTPDEVCARDFFNTGRVAYQCQRGARWACCLEDEAGEELDTKGQNLGICTRVTTVDTEQEDSVSTIETHTTIEV